MFLAFGIRTLRISAAIVASPDDDTLRLVYADWLDEKGDPRGTFIRLDLALAEVPPRADSALLQPSDHVDIIGSFAVPKPGFTMPASGTANFRTGPDMVNIVLLQNVTVLAVGDQFSGALSRAWTRLCNP